MLLRGGVVDAASTPRAAAAAGAAGKGGSAFGRPHSSWGTTKSEPDAASVRPYLQCVVSRKVFHEVEGT